MHRAMREPPTRSPVLVGGDATMQRPRGIMDRKSARFQKLLAPEGQQLEELRDLFHGTRALAEEPRPTLSGERLRAAGRRMKQAAA
eukprot:1868976-Pyramimonas_sp.AAC.1